MLVHTRRRISMQMAGAISLVLALAGMMVYCVVVSGQEAAARRELASAARRADIAYPPPCVWLVELRDGVERRSPGTPAALPERTALSRVAADGRTRVDQVVLADATYLIRTQRRGEATIQVAMDLRYQAAERERLLRTLGVMEVAGLLAALLIGQVFAARAIAPLGEALARQRRFATDVSHELRTPLARLHTRAQLVSRRLRRGVDPMLVIDDVERLVTGSRQLSEVVEDLLLSARFPRSRPFGPVDLAVIAEELAAAEAARAEERGVTIDVRLHDPGPHVVHGAQPAMRRVVSALVDNALGHTRPGGHIWITLSRDAKTVRLTVRDDGVGLDPRDAERIFARFAGGSDGRGFGLGLALVREVVDSHGGTIIADGRPGGGAVFTVRLPAATAAADEAAHHPLQRSRPDAREPERHC